MSPRGGRGPSKEELEEKRIKEKKYCFSRKSRSKNGVTHLQ